MRVSKMISLEWDDTHHVNGPKYVNASQHYLSNYSQSVFLFIASVHLRTYPKKNSFASGTSIEK